jgi:hypothetical protein
MLSKCLNPACSTPFRYLRDGRIYNLTLPQPTASAPKASRRELFWLCGRCMTTLTISIRNGAVSVEPRFLELPSGERIEQSDDEIPYPGRAI